MKHWYAYFDINGKFWWIPYDYDNTIGHSIKQNPDPYARSPFEWHLTAENGQTGLVYGHRPLVEKMLEIPEFKAIYRKYLMQISGDTYVLNSMARVNKWHGLIGDYINSPDLVYDNDTKTVIGEGDWGSPETHFARMRDNILRWCLTHKVTFDLNGGNISGSTDAVVINNATSKFSDLIVTPDNTGKLFKGWTLTKNGSDYIETVDPEDSEITVYAKWVLPSEIIEPFTVDENGLHFTFDPVDWGYVNPKTVHCIGYDNDSGRGDGQWHMDNKYKMTKQSDGTFTLTVPLDVGFGTDSWSMRFCPDGTWEAALPENYRFVELVNRVKYTKNGNNYDWSGLENSEANVFKYFAFEFDYDGSELDGIGENAIIGQFPNKISFKSYPGISGYEIDPKLDGKKIYLAKDNSRVCRNGVIYVVNGQTIDLADYALKCEGKVFEGWYANAGYTGDPLTTVVVGNVWSHATLYAKWSDAPAE